MTRLGAIGITAEWQHKIKDSLWASCGVSTNLVELRSILPPPGVRAL
jgi:hypothetical protein